MMQQMNPMQPQGIGALLGGMPQGMPQNKPMGSPRAAIGSVQDRVNAYRPNPAMLEQQAGVSGDLLDLLAAQKLKSEKEAALRSLTLQQGAQQGEPPTIAQQRDEELKQMTKQELAPQVAQTAQKEEQDKQAAMQRLMSGIAGAPGAGQVMPRMASGGVVAFQNMGEVPDPAAMAMDELRTQEAAKRKLIAQLRRQMDLTTDPRELRSLQRQIEDVERGGAAVAQAVAPQSQPLPPVPQAPARTPADFSGGPEPRGVNPPVRPAMPPQGAQPRRPPMPMGPGPGLASTTVGRGITMPGAAQARPQLPTEIGGGLEAGSALRPAMQTAPEAPGEGGLAGLLKATGIDPAAEAERIRKQAEGVYGVRPEQRTPLESEIARLKRGLEPKETRWYDRLSELVPYLSEQRIRPGEQGLAGGLGRIASAGAQMRKAGETREEAQRKQLSELQAKLAEMDQASKAKIFEAGLGAEQRAREAQARTGQLGVGLEGVAATREGQVSSAASATADRALRERLAQLELDARAAEGVANRASEVERARISAAAQNRPGETERLLASFEALKGADPKKAAEFLETVERLKGAGKGITERQDLNELKALQASLQKQVGDYTLPKATRDAAAAQLNEVNAKLGQMAGISTPTGGAPLYATNPQTKERIMSTDGGKTWQPAR